MPGPAPADRDDVRRLHFVNALFARLTGDDLYLARQIQEAIAFSLAELAEQTRARPELAARYDAAFTAAAARLRDPQRRHRRVRDGAAQENRSRRLRAFRQRV